MVNATGALGGGEHSKPLAGSIFCYFSYKTLPDSPGIDLLTVIVTYFLEKVFSAYLVVPSVILLNYLSSSCAASLTYNTFDLKVLMLISRILFEYMFYFERKNYLAVIVLRLLFGPNF